MKTKVNNITKSMDKELARIKTFALNILAPLTSILEARYHTKSCWLLLRELFSWLVIPTKYLKYPISACKNLYCYHKVPNHIFSPIISSYTTCTAKIQKNIWFWDTGEKDSYGLLRRSPCTKICSWYCQVSL